MPELNCEQCNAHLVYQPGDHHLTCPYCQHEHVIEPPNKPTAIEENDVQAYLNDLELNVSQEQIRTIKCTGCGAETTLEDNLRSTFCPFCATPLVIEKAKDCQRIQPHYIVPFELNKNDAVTAYKKWIKSLWFAPNIIKKHAHQQTELKGVYLPFWTYDANTATNYNGMRGDYYYVSQSYINSKGERRTRRVRRTRWRPVSGNVRYFFDDILVAATRSLPTDKLEALEPWDLKNMCEYDPRYLVGFISEQYSISLQEGLVQGKAKMSEGIEQLVRHDIGGDEQRITQRNSHYSDLRFKHILLPLWVSSYRYKNKAYQFLINARTGEVQGQRPWSWVKIGLLILTVAVIIGGLFWYGKRG